MKNILILLISILVITSCKKDKKEVIGNDNIEASVRLNWIASCSFVGEITGAKEFAKSNKLDLKVETGGPGLDPIKLVQSGVNTFGVAGADLVLAANDKGADLVVIGLVSYNSPGVWLAKKEKKINSIEDIKGKRIGELPGGNMQYLYEVFLKKTGLVRKKDFTPTSIPFELKNFIAQDECDLRPVFIYDEPSALEMNGIEYSLIEPKDFGIQFKGLCYFTKQSTIDQSSEVVQAFVNTMIQGWKESLKNPKSAIENLKKFDNTVSEEKELLGLKKGMSYFQGYNGKLLNTDLESWIVMAKDMKDLGFLNEMPNLDKAINLSFVEDYYNKNK